MVMILLRERFTPGVVAEATAESLGGRIAALRAIQELSTDSDEASRSAREVSDLTVANGTIDSAKTQTTAGKTIR